jgi:hypothetical protein
MKMAEVEHAITPRKRSRYLTNIGRTVPDPKARWQPIVG